MVILLLVFLAVAIGLAIYAFLPSKSSSESQVLTGIMPQAPVNQEPVILRLEEQVNYLNTELDKLRLEQQKDQNELKTANKLVSDLKEELAKLKEQEPPKIDYGALEKLKADISKSKEELLNKNRELEKSLSENMDLNRELKENKAVKEKQALLETENKKLADKIVLADKQLLDYKKEIESKTAEIKKYQTLGEQVCKKDYDELSQKFNIENDKVEKLNSENSDLINKMKILEVQITEHNKEMGQQRDIVQKYQQMGEQVSKKEFDDLGNKLNEEKAALDKFKKENAELSGRLKSFEDKINEYDNKIKEQDEFIDKEKNKCEGCASKKELAEVQKKLENAEQVLRIVHGAGTDGV